MVESPKEIQGKNENGERGGKGMEGCYHHQKFLDPPLFRSNEINSQHVWVGVKTVVFTCVR